MDLINPALTMEWLRSHSSGIGVMVAVIDSGVDAAHPDLGDAVTGGVEVRTDDCGEIICVETAANECKDSYGHGTAVAGAIRKIAPACQVVSVKVLNDYNCCTGHELIAGLQWALDRNIKIINMSLATSKKDFAPRLFELCEQAYAQDAIIVASKRNFPPTGWPALFSNVISVDRDDYETLFQLEYSPQSTIEFKAHGTDITLPSPGGGYSVQTGTSFATPLISGVVALLVEAFPGLLAWEAKTIMKSMAARPAPLC